MNQILDQIKDIIGKNIREYLPDVKPEDLEEDGAVFYMNAKNGTEWDYYVNDHLSYFMVFYNEQDHLGAAKLGLYSDGYVRLTLYGEKGKELLKTVETEINAEEKDLLKSALLLKQQMDDQGRFDADTALIDADKEPAEEELTEFRNAEKDFEGPRNRMKLMPEKALVSRKILDEGYKAGYMCREEPVTNSDSGWQFLAGNEDDEYSGNEENIAILSLKEVVDLDPDVWKYIDSPVGSALIRISSNEFEEDHNDKPIFIEKR